MEAMSTAEVSTTITNRHMPLTTPLFQKALVSHLDITKPDRLARTQAESLVLRWDDDDSESLKSDCADEGGTSVTNGSDRSIRGTLTLEGEFASVSIGAKCSWRDGREKETSADKGEIGQLWFELTVAAKLIPATKARRSFDRKEAGGTPAIKKAGSRKEDRAMRKVRSGMVQRLKADHYVGKLLEADAVSRPTARKKLKMNKLEENGGPIVLCKAVIWQHKHNAKVELEERVDVSEDSLEGVRRAILSRSDGNIAVMELLLALPFLPRQQHTKQGLEYSPEIRGEGEGDVPLLPRESYYSTPLADRACLRLLEDAMLDACEREGEDEMIDDLNLAEKERSECSYENDVNDERGKGSLPKDQQWKRTRTLS